MRGGSPPEPATALTEGAGSHDPRAARSRADHRASGFGANHGDQIRRALQIASQRPPHGEDLVGWLYARWYATGAAGPSPTADGSVEYAALPPGTFTAAHADSDRWEDGATVVSTGQAGAVVVRTAGGRVRALGRGDYLCPAGLQGLAPPVGVSLRIRVRQGCVVADGWWRTWGGDRRASTTGAVSRIYLAPDPEVVTTLVTQITTELRDVRHPWTLKVGADARALDRPDGAVVYVPDAALLSCLHRLAPALRGLLRPHTPALTAPVAPGIAWAHDPGDGQSFGEHRCSLIADVHRAAITPATPADVAAAFRRAGLDPSAPHLRARDGAA